MFCRLFKLLFDLAVFVLRAQLTAGSRANLWLRSQLRQIGTSAQTDVEPPSRSISWTPDKGIHMNEKTVPNDFLCFCREGYFCPSVCDTYGIEECPKATEETWMQQPAAQQPCSCGIQTFTQKACTESQGMSLWQQKLPNKTRSPAHAVFPPPQKIFFFW